MGAHFFPLNDTGLFDFPISDRVVASLDLNVEYCRYYCTFTKTSRRSIQFGLLLLMLNVAVSPTDHHDATRYTDSRPTEGFTEQRHDDVNVSGTLPSSFLLSVFLSVLCFLFHGEPKTTSTTLTTNRETYCQSTYYKVFFYLLWWPPSPPQPEKSFFFDPSFFSLPAANSLRWRCLSLSLYLCVD